MLFYIFSINLLYMSLRNFYCHFSTHIYWYYWIIFRKTWWNL